MNFVPIFMFTLYIPFLSSYKLSFNFVICTLNQVSFGKTGFLLMIETNLVGWHSRSRIIRTPDWSFVKELSVDSLSRLRF
jgi:hypothetical protein